MVFIVLAEIALTPDHYGMVNFPFLFSLSSILFAGCVILFFVIDGYRAARNKKNPFRN